MKKTLALVIAVLVTTGVGVAQSPAADLLQEGLRLQEVNGDLPAAIQVYKRILERHARDTAIAPKALLQLAVCYETLGRTEARQTYERIVRDYPNSGAPAATARAKLQAMTGPGGDPFRRRTIDLIAEAGSLDGRLAAYHKNNEWGRLFVRDLSSGNERMLSDLPGIASNPAFSPDGRHLAFDYQHAPSKTRETRLADTTTGEMRILPVRHGYPWAWVRPGELMVYRPNYPNNTVDMSFVNVTDGTVRRVLPIPMNEGPPGVSPDGRTMVIVRSKRMILIDTESGAERPLTKGSAEEARAVFSADGRLLAFASNADGKWAMYVAPTDEAPVAEPVRLGYIDESGLSGTRGARADWWTKDGLLTMAFTHAGSNIYRIPVDPRTGRASGDPLRLTQDAQQNFGPAISPDSRHIAYWRRVGAKAGLALMNADGINERLLMEQSGVLPLSWLSAEEILSYDFATPAGEKPAITAFPIAGGASKKVAQVEGLYWTFVPSTNEILHWGPGGGGARLGAQLKARSVTTGQDRIVAQIDNLLHVTAVSRDGARLAYAVSAQPGSVSDPQCEIRTMSLQGTEQKVVLPMQRPCGVPDSWSADGRFLLVSTMTGPRILNVESQESWPVHDAAQGTEWRDGSWSPDGSFIVLTHASTRNERLAWEAVTYDAVKKLMRSRK